MFQIHKNTKKGKVVINTHWLITSYLMHQPQITLHLFVVLHWHMTHYWPTAVCRAMRARAGVLVAIAIYTPTLAAAAVALVGPVVTFLITGWQVLTCEPKTHGRHTVNPCNTLLGFFFQCVHAQASHQSVSSPLAFCWYWTALLYTGNLKGRDMGGW